MATLIKFKANWCNPCKQMIPVLDRAEDERDGLHVVEIDVDSDRDLADAFDVTTIPAMFLVECNLGVDTDRGDRKASEKAAADALRASGLGPDDALGSVIGPKPPVQMGRFFDEHGVTKTLN